MASPAERLMPMKIAIIGAGIAGLTLALNLKKKGIACHLFERVPDVKEIGVGITLLPHAMREFTELGLGEALHARGIENLESCFYNRFGQLLYKEPRGKYAGYNRSEEHTSELQSLMRISYAVFCLKKKNRA